MRARRARRYPECRANLLVRPPRGDEPDDLELAPGQTRDALRQRAARRTRAELAELLARAVQLSLRTQMREHLVRATKLPRRALAIAGLRQRARQLTTHPRGIGHEWNRFEPLCCAAEKRHRARRVTLEQLDHGIAGVGPGKPEALSERGGLAPQPRAELASALDVARPQRRLGDDRHEAVNRPDYVPRSVGDAKTAFADADCIGILTDREMVRGAADMRRHDVVHVAHGVGDVARARQRPRFVHARLAAIDLAASEVEKPEPDEEPWQQRALAQRARKVDRPFGERYGVIPIAGSRGVFDLDLRRPDAEQW